MSGVKTCSFIILVLCLFTHACTARFSAVSISHKKFYHRKFSFLGANDKVGFSPKEIEDLCSEDRDTQATNSGSGDCMSSVEKALLQPPKPQGSTSRWAHDSTDHVHVREMDLRPSFFTEQDFSETDYQPPRRKSPIHNK